METDREILMWFHERLVHVHKESQLYDYMYRLRWIIMSLPKKKTSRGQQKRYKKVISYSIADMLLKNGPTALEKSG